MRVHSQNEEVKSVKFWLSFTSDFFLSLTETWLMIKIKGEKVKKGEKSESFWQIKTENEEVNL